MLDFNGILKSAQSLSGRRIEFSYQGTSRAIALLDCKPVRIEIDGFDAPIDMRVAARHFALMLPRGQHVVTMQAE
jgi:hypothetical protein